MIKDSDWEKLKNKPENVLLHIISTGYGTSGTNEEILWDSQFGLLYRRRYWLDKPKGEVWFKFIGHYKLQLEPQNG